MVLTPSSRNNGIKTVINIYIHIYMSDKRYKMMTYFIHVWFFKMYSYEFIIKVCTLSSLVTKVYV